jgi:hypothetical protein
MTRFVKSQNSFRLTEDTSSDVFDTIPVGTYQVNCDKFGFFLTGTDNFTLPEKIYGNSTKLSSRILNTFLSRDASTGVMLSGQKGSGKTLLAKQISIEAQTKSIPTFIVNSPYCGDDFNMFLQSFTQPVVVVFDEFEKVYDNNAQNTLLTLFDGTFSQKKLFVLTSNSPRGISEYFRDRPGRIRYWLEYKTLDNEFVTDYCNDNLDNKEYQEQIQNLCAILGFNFDMLQSLIHEMNMYGESPYEAMKILNVKGNVQGYSTYDYTVYEESNPQISIYSYHWTGVPMSINDQITIKQYKDDDGDTDWINVRIAPSNLIKSDFVNGKYTFKVIDEGIPYIIVMIQRKGISQAELAYAYGNGSW